MNAYIKKLYREKINIVYKLLREGNCSFLEFTKLPTCYEYISEISKHHSVEFGQVALVIGLLYAMLTDITCLHRREVL